MEYVDSEVKVPWGHVAVRLWGDEKNEPVLMVHGVLDNVGTFDRLIPFLPNCFYYICMDLPGHGKSSHWPPYTIYNTLDNLLAFKAVVDYFKRGKYIIASHSFGAQNSFIFAQVYPEYVTKLIMLDAFYLYPHPTGNLKKTLRDLHEAYFNTMKKLATKNPPSYTYEEALDKLINFRWYGQLTQEAAIPLLNRRMIPAENGKLHLTTDQRIKFNFNPPFDFRYITDFIKKSPVLCPVLIIIASDSDTQQVYFKRLIKFLRTYKNFQFKFVVGHHDVHNTHPERVAPLMTEFLLYQRSKA